MTVHIYNEQAHSMPQMAAALPQNDKYGYQAHLQRIHKETPRHSCLTDQHDLIFSIIHHHDEKINLLRNNKAPLSAIFIVIINKFGNCIILCICIKLLGICICFLGIAQKLIFLCITQVRPFTIFSLTTSLVCNIIKPIYLIQQYI